MIELLVTMVLLGLIVAVVAPGLESWLSSRKADAVRMEVSSKFAMLPLVANRSGQSVIIDTADKLGVADISLSFPQPIIVNANGFCQGGRFQLQQGDSPVNFDVLSPYCEVRRVEQN